MNGRYYMDEQTLRQVVEIVGRTAAAAAVSSFLAEVVLKGFISQRPTRILLESGIPATLYAVGAKDAPAEVYVSSKRDSIDWRPALFFTGVFIGCKYLLEYREKHIANVR